MGILSNLDRLAGMPAVGVCDCHGDGHPLCGSLLVEPSYLFSAPEAASSAGDQHLGGGRAQPWSVGPPAGWSVPCLIV